LRQRSVVRIELMEIDLHIVLLGGPSPCIHLHDARYRQ